MAARLDGTAQAQQAAGARLDRYHSGMTSTVRTFGLRAAALLAATACAAYCFAGGPRPPICSAMLQAAPVSSAECAAQQADAGNQGGAATAGESTGQVAQAAEIYSPLSPFDNFHPIVEGRAYRSAQVTPATLIYMAESHCIRTVINLRGENSWQPWYQLEKAACEALGLKMIDVRMGNSGLPEPATLLALFDALKEAEEPILLHCKSGADRTGMAAALWRMTALGENAADAKRELSLTYGHFTIAKPAMSLMVEMFVPDRKWIRKDFPKLRKAAEEKARAADGDDEAD